MVIRFCSRVIVFFHDTADERRGTLKSCALLSKSLKREDASQGRRYKLDIVFEILHEL